MHRFWETNEMVYQLADVLQEHYWAFASTVALACCSKQLGHIILDSLWEDCLGLSTLMKCLPPDTWEVRDNKFVGTTCSGLLTLGAYQSTGLPALPLYRGMDPIFQLCS
jgi:hypothetical protein